MPTDNSVEKCTVVSKSNSHQRRIRTSTSASSLVKSSSSAFHINEVCEVIDNSI